MPEYQLYCFAQSGNAYRAALMLNLIGADWQPVYVDFFKGGETRTITKGDLIVVPHGTAHWFKELKGPLNYYVVKVRAAN